jgi:hypothetical protein
MTRLPSTLVVTLLLQQFASIFPLGTTEFAPAFAVATQPLTVLVATITT